VEKREIIWERVTKIQKGKGVENRYNEINMPETIQQGEGTIARDTDHLEKKH